MSSRRASKKHMISMEVIPSNPSSSDESSDCVSHNLEDCLRPGSAHLEPLGPADVALPAASSDVSLMTDAPRCNPLAMMES